MSLSPERQTEVPLVSPAGLAAQLDVPVGTLRQWRYTGTGPKYIRVGRHVRYRQSDIDAWLAAQEQD